MNHPLHWPAGWKRTPRPTRSRFGNLTVYCGVAEVLGELSRLGAHDAVISTNVQVRLNGLPRSGQAAPDDPGVAVYYVLKKERYVLACDAWEKVSHNLRAIARHIGALRGIDRWGVGSIERAFGGYLRLEAAGNDKPTRSCWEVLGLDSPPWPRSVPVTSRDVERRFRFLSIERHPDIRQGSTKAFTELGRARDEAKITSRRWEPRRRDRAAPPPPVLLAVRCESPRARRPTGRHAPLPTRSLAPRVHGWAHRRARRRVDVPMNDHEAKLIEADSMPWGTDCSTPAFQRVRNMAARIQGLENTMARQTFTIHLTRTILYGSDREIIVDARASIESETAHPQVVLEMLREQCRDEIDQLLIPKRREDNLEIPMERTGRRGDAGDRPPVLPPRAR